MKCCAAHSERRSSSNQRCGGGAFVGKSKTGEGESSLRIQDDAKALECFDCFGEKSLTARFVNWRPPGIGNRYPQSFETRCNGRGDSRRARGDHQNIRLHRPPLPTTFTTAAAPVRNRSPVPWPRGCSSSRGRAAGAYKHPRAREAPTWKICRRPCASNSTTPPDLFPSAPERSR